MTPFKIYKLNFLTIFLENRSLNSFYSSITNVFSGQVEFRNISATQSNPKNIILVKDVPEYLDAQINEDLGWRMRKLKTFKGSLINLTNYKDETDYLLKTFSGSRRSKFRTNQKRLEKCFNISYKTYYGDIEKDEYESLFDKFLELINRRFDQKELINDDLVRWKVYRDIAYPLILKKEACLFVIYDSDKPISISFNPIHGKTIFGYIRGYDIDYGKFYIGFTDIIVQLKWCFENNFTTFDLLKGEYEYKSQWTDTQYYFEKHLIYDSSRLLSNLRAKSIIFVIKTMYLLINLLKKRNLHIVFGNIRSYLRRPKINPNKAISKAEISIETDPELPKTCDGIKMDICDKRLAIIKMYIYNFLYQNQESINNIVVLRLLDSPNSFLIKGTKNSQKITVS